MSEFKAHKVVSALPNPLDADTIYFVRTGAGFDIYVSDTTGNVAYTANNLTKADIDALGIDADTLDGLQASSFVRSDVADEKQGSLTLFGQLTIPSSSGANINHQFERNNSFATYAVTAPKWRLWLAGAGESIAVENSGKVQLNYGNQQTKLETTSEGVDVAGKAIVTGSGTIGLTNPDNGYVQVKDGNNTLSIDPNEIYGTNGIILNGGANEIQIYGANSRKLRTYSDGIVVEGNILADGTVDGRDVAADGTKLDGIEENATADQTPTEIKTAYESNADTNVFTDTDKANLNEAHGWGDHAAVGYLVNQYSDTPQTFTKSTAAQVDFNGNNGLAEYPHLRGGTVDLGDVTYEAAIAHAAKIGVRLPTLEESLAGVMQNTGQGFDSQFCWTSTDVSGDPTRVYVVKINAGGAPPEIETRLKDGTGVAKTRYVANVDTPLATDLVKTSGAAGQSLATTFADRTFVNFANLPPISLPFDYSEFFTLTDNNLMTINKPGTYQMEFRATASHSTGTRTTVHWQPWVDGDETEGMFTYHRATPNSLGTALLTKTFEVTSTAQVKVSAYTIQGAACTLYDTPYMTIRKI